MIKLRLKDMEDGVFLTKSSIEVEQNVPTPPVFHQSIVNEKTLDRQKPQGFESDKWKILLFVSLLIFLIALIFAIPSIISFLRLKADSKKANSRINQSIIEQPPINKIWAKNEILVFVKDEGLTSHPKFYDITNKTEIIPDGNYKCIDSCRTMLYDWSPDGQILPFAVFDIKEIENQEWRIYYFDKSTNSIYHFKTVDRKNSDYASIIDSLIFNRIVWISNTKFRIGQAVFDLVPKIITVRDSENLLTAETFPEVWQGSDFLNKHIVYKQIINDTGIEKFQGFFGPKSIQDNAYTVEVNRKVVIETKATPQGFWRGYVVTFEPSIFKQALDAASELDVSEASFAADENEIQKQLVSKLGPQSGATISLYSIESQLAIQTISIPNDNVWINYDIQPRPKANSIILFQSEFVQIPQGNTRIIELDVSTPTHLRTVKDLNVSGMEFFSGLNNHEMITNDGKYLVLIFKLDEEDPQAVSNNKIELLNLDTAATEVVCESHCADVKLYVPYAIHPL